MHFIKLGLYTHTHTHTPTHLHTHTHTHTYLQQLPPLPLGVSLLPAHKHKISTNAPASLTQYIKNNPLYVQYTFEAIVVQNAVYVGCGQPVTTTKYVGIKPVNRSIRASQNLSQLPETQPRKYLPNQRVIGDIETSNKTDKQNFIRGAGASAPSWNGGVSPRGAGASAPSWNGGVSPIETTCMAYSGF